MLRINPAGAVGYAFGCQGTRSRITAFRMGSSLRMAAASATLPGSPCRCKKLWKASIGGCGGRRSRLPWRGLCLWQRGRPGHGEALVVDRCSGSGAPHRPKRSPFGRWMPRLRQFGGEHGSHHGAIPGHAALQPDLDMSGWKVAQPGLGFPVQVFRFGLQPVPDGSECGAVWQRMRCPDEFPSVRTWRSAGVVTPRAHVEARRSASGRGPHRRDPVCRLAILP